MDDPRLWLRLRRRPVVWFSVLTLGFLALAAFVLPGFLPADYREPSGTQLVPPSLAHPFGTDLNGRDVLYLVLNGTRISLVVGLAGAFIALVIGTTYGMIAGYAGGKVDAAMMRLVDIFYSVPRLIFILVLINALNHQVKVFATEQGWDWLVLYSRIAILIVSLGFIEWLTMARIVRGQVLALKGRTFVTAAVALGQSHGRILLSHLLPNLIGVILIYLTLTIPAVIIDESFLSFLGLGVEAPLASLGSLLSSGASAINPIKSSWWLLVFPAMVMILLLLSLNLLGDALRDAADPSRNR